MNSSQKSIYYPININPYRNQVPHYQNHFYSDLFLEDIRNFLKPKDFEISLKNSSEKDEKFIINAFDNKFNNNLTKAVSSFIVDCVLDLIYFKEANYEIVFNVSNETPFEYIKIPFKSLKIKNNEYYQHIPEKICELKGLSMNNIKLNSDNVILFKSPNSYDELLIDSLMKITPNLELFFKNNLNAREISYFECESLANLTKDIGWNFRLEFKSYDFLFEYYYIYRKIKFNKFLSEFRESILLSLNESFQRISEEINFDNQLVWNKKPEYYDELMINFENKKYSISDIIKKL